MHKSCKPLKKGKNLCRKYISKQVFPFVTIQPNSLGISNIRKKMESEGEIEYLDEDAEIVQQLVQVPSALPIAEEVNTPLLVERKSTERKRKKKKDTEDDSDYDPTEDMVPASTSTAKKKKPVSRKSVTKPAVELSKSPIASPKSHTSEIMNRKKMDIRLPDYEDPLCLPVRAIRSIGSDVNRLKKWNNACIEHFKQCDNLFKPENGETKSSSRTIVLSNVIHKQTGRRETAVWSKTCVVNKEGIKKSEIFQCMLPKYREKTVLRPFRLGAYKKKYVHHVNEVLLTKENQKNSEVMVAYKPREALSAIYKFDEDEKLICDGSEENNDDDEGSRRALRELASCRVCVPCYQASGRGHTDKTEKKKLSCPVCGRSSISLYNLLTHVRAHPAAQVRARRRQLAVILAGVVEYHYKCRICDEKFESIKELREHLRIHKGSIPFRCEVGNHLTT